jgi:hypothetical protein
MDCLFHPFCRERDHHDPFCIKSHDSSFLLTPTAVLEHHPHAP